MNILLSCIASISQELPVNMKCKPVPDCFQRGIGCARIDGYERNRFVIVSSDRSCGASSRPDFGQHSSLDTWSILPSNGAIAHHWECDRNPQCGSPALLGRGGRTDNRAACAAGCPNLQHSLAAFLFPWRRSLVGQQRLELVCFLPSPSFGRRRPAVQRHFRTKRRSNYRRELAQ